MWDSVKGALSPEEQKKVEALWTDPAVIAAVRADIARGRAANVSRAPTMIVTHRARRQAFTEFDDYPAFCNYLDGLLKK